MIAAFKADKDQKQLSIEMKKILKEYNISKEDLKESRLFTISPKTSPHQTTINLVKNKFQISSGDRSVGCDHSINFSVLNNVNNIVKLGVGQVRSDF